MNFQFPRECQNQSSVEGRDPSALTFAAISVGVVMMVVVVTMPITVALVLMMMMMMPPLQLQENYGDENC
jgi:hypothetical protein